ncbi:MAG: chitobiase/beta-hexosaminidase C-terminal domain-containing protein, partial [Spirochaetes bacterium]|nr:chitobiase/beta-hexosaminidase C-terminal domain-containing protein [Spirochaetota bacterium]
MPLLTCTGFKGTFVDASGNAFKANATLYLQGACGAKIAARAIDLDGDGIADGIDLNGDGIADVRYIPMIANQLAGLDINGDGKSDYFMTVGLNDAIKITTEQAGGNEVTLTADAAGQVTGFDLTGDCNADNTIIADLRTDTTPPTSSANSSGGAFNAAQTVTLTCTDNFACNGIAYTLDGSTPQFNGNGHVIVGAVGNVVVADTSTLHFQARDANGNLETSIHSLNFTIVGASVSLPPAYTPATGYYSVAQNIALTNQTSGAAICYTTNTTTPTCTGGGVCSVGQIYSGTIAVTNVAIIRAVACKAGLAASPMVTLAYAIDGTAPGNASSFTAIPGDTQVSLSWVNPADADLAGIRIVRKIGSYPANTTDGTVIYTATGTSFTDTSVVNGTQYYYKAFAYDGVPNYASGVQATATPSGGSANQPTYSPTAATYGVAQNITISTTTPGALICYTTSGATPACSAVPACTTGTAYASVVNIALTATLKAIACKAGYIDSGVASGVYTIDTTPPGNVSPFNASPASTQVDLSWTNP